MWKEASWTVWSKEEEECTTLLCSSWEQFCGPRHLWCYGTRKARRQWDISQLEKRGSRLDWLGSACLLAKLCSCFRFSIRRLGAIEGTLPNFSSSRPNGTCLFLPGEITYTPSHIISLICSTYCIYLVVKEQAFFSWGEYSYLARTSHTLPPPHFILSNLSPSQLCWMDLLLATQQL